MPTHVDLVGKFRSGDYVEVYEGRGDVAVKIAKPPASVSLKREAQALKLCQEAHVPHLVDHFEYTPNVERQGNQIRRPIQAPKHEHKCDVLVMPLIHGGSLKDKLENGALDEKSTWQIAKSLLETLAIMHERAQIVHRNIDASNIMFEGKEVFLIDFSLATRDDNPKNQKSDLWNLGLLLYQSITGHKPFLTTTSLDKALPFPKNINPLCQDFIQTLLTPTNERPSAREALEHPWISEQQHQKVILGPPVKRKTLIEDMPIDNDLRFIVRSQAGAFETSRNVQRPSSGRPKFHL